MRGLIGFIVLLTFAGCGDPLIDGNYRGEPLFTIRGTITVGENAGAYASASTRVAVLWIGARQQELFGQGVSQSSFPAQYSLTIYSEPTEGAQQVIPRAQQTYALARIVLYQDVNGNEQLDLGERLIGGSDDKLIAYFPESGTAEAVGGPFDVGFSAMGFLPCDSRLDTEPNTYMKPVSSSSVDLRLTGEISTALSDLDCDSVPDDLCIQALAVLQENPEDDLTLDFYHENCDSNFGREVDDLPKNNHEPDNNTPNNTPNNEPVNNDQTSCPPKTSEDITVDSLGGELFELCQGTQLQDCRSVRDELLEAPFLNPDGEQNFSVWSLLHEFAECMGFYDPCVRARMESPYGPTSRSYGFCVFDYFQETFPEPNCDLVILYVEELPEGDQRDAFLLIRSEFCPAD